MQSRPSSPAAQLHSVATRAILQPPGIDSRKRKWPDSTAEVSRSVSTANSQSPAGLNQLEAVLFLAREPLTSRKIAQLALLEDGTQARTLIRKLNEHYDAVGRSFRVEEVAGGYQLLTRQKFGPWLRRLAHIPSEVRLSTPALETLAVVAYRQPVLKADIEAIRGVQCGEILRQLMERDLVRIGGRSEELGRPYLYATTKRFLQQFGLRGVEELPRAEILRSPPLPPVGKGDANGHHTANQERPALELNQRTTLDKESDVSVTLTSEMNYPRQAAKKFAAAPALPFVPPPVRADDEDDFEDDEADDEDDDDDLDDDEEEDELEEEEDDEELADDEWEEVEDEDDAEEDEEEDDDFDDDEDEEWDDEDDDDLDDDEEEEEELDEE